MVPPNTHQKYIAKRAIQNFKNNLIAILTIVDSKFPIFNGGKLLPQSVLTLNLFHLLNVAFKVSEYTYILWAIWPHHYDTCTTRFKSITVREKDINGKGGAARHWIYGTWEHHPNTIDSSEFEILNQKQKELMTQYFLNKKYITQPTLTPEDTLLKAIQDICHAQNWNTIFNSHEESFK